MDDLTKKLIEHALKARSFAFAPASCYRVGASVLCENNQIVVGCNVENSKFLPVGTCAEVTALHSARAQGYKEFLKMAIVSENQVSPCGKCREVIFDHNPEMELILATPRLEYKTVSIRDLLPYRFELKP